MTAILALIDHDRGKLNAASLEMLTLARQLASAKGASLEAVIIGQEGEGVADELKSYALSAIHLISHDGLSDYAPRAWGTSLHQLIQTKSPEALLGPGTERGNEVLAQVAASADLPLAANCTEVEPGEPYRITRSRWGGSLLEEAHLKGSPKLITVAPHTFPAEEASQQSEVSIEPFTPTLDEQDLSVRVVDRVTTTESGVSLGDASVVIGGGRGVGGPEGFEVLEELGGLLGAPVGGSRVATNNGWRAHADQIGLTGTKIAPDLYIACGISGAVQHMVGCKGSKHILVINSDREAPILSKADYAVIGDLHEILPAIIEEVKKAKAS